jgi:hypothetical protein
VSKFETKVKVAKLLERELSRQSAEQYKSWNDKKAKRAVVPDITVANHPMTTQCIDTIHYGTARTQTAIFEVKGIMKCPTRYATDISPTTKTATDRRARQVEKDYANRTKNMDRDVMGHDNATEPGPWAKVLGKPVEGRYR